MSEDMDATRDARWYTDANVDSSIAQARKWASSGDNGWMPTREQVLCLAHEVERLRAALAAAS